MPLWCIYHPDDAFTDEESKNALSESITRLYTSTAGLPAFYVVVTFIHVPARNMYVGGLQVAGNPFIRISIDQIAVRLDDSDELYSRWTALIDKMLKPHIEDKGYDWEYHIDETERRLWKINGTYAPPFGSRSEKLWAAANKVLPWEENGVSQPSKTKI